MQFIPFSDRVRHDLRLEDLGRRFDVFRQQDPMMAQFPLVLAIEPRLLPLARQNGFNMDRRVRPTSNRTAS